MRRINYKNRDALANEYIKIFYDIQEKQNEWERILIDMENKNIIKRGYFNTDIKQIIMADFRTLASIYLKYIKLQGVDENMENNLKKIFNYTPKYQPLIADFFMQHKNDLDISTCYYCDMSYINCYGQNIYDKNTLLEMLNTEDAQQLQQDIGYCLKTTSSIVTEKNKGKFANEADFNSRAIYRKLKFDAILDKITKKHIEKNHFDLDHVLDKGSCPIVALSLFNFVPSCQVCNEKLKRSKVLSNNIKDLCLYSPTCDDYKFDEKVSITVKPFTQTTSYVDNKDNYSIEFDCSKEKKYEDEVKLFKLEDRYNYHKIEALRLMDLKQKYNESHIEEIASLIYGNNDADSINHVKDDIFQYYFKQEYHRTFGKLYKDILS